MSWKAQLRKAPFFGFGRKKPQPQPSETPEETNKKKEENLIFEALWMPMDALQKDTSMSDDRHMKLIRLLQGKISKFHAEGHMGSTGIEGAKRFLNYLAHSSSTFPPSLTDAARKALSTLENER